MTATLQRAATTATTPTAGAPSADILEQAAYISLPDITPPAQSLAPATLSATPEEPPQVQPLQSAAVTGTEPLLHSPLTETSDMLGRTENVTRGRRAEHVNIVGGADEQAVTSERSHLPDLDGFTTLRIWAESFDDAQRARISCANRMLRGGVPPEMFAPQLEALLRAEHEIGKAMRKSYKLAAPASVVAWQKGSLGIGDHLLARLLGTVGHPVIATPYHWEGEGDKRTLVADLPFERTVSQLWAYCGVGDPTRKRRKGMSADDAMALGSPRAKMLVRLIAEGSMKARGEHRPVYDLGRAKYADREGWTLGHQHAAALRLTGKAILRDLWLAAR